MHIMLSLINNIINRYIESGKSGVLYDMIIGASLGIQAWNCLNKDKFNIVKRVCVAASNKWI